MKKKIALITGVTGQDGAYLSKFLLDKNYVVHGLKRRSSLINTTRIDDIFSHKNFHLHHGDMTDSLSIQRVLEKTKPDEIYNLAAQSHVAVSFDQPEYTSNTAGLGTLRLLESIRILKMKSVKFYQAGTSEMFGNSYSKKQNEKTPLIPRSPYAAAKLYAHWVTINLSCKELGIKIFWKGNGINTLGLDQKNRVIIRCSKKYYRPTEVDSLLGDSTKARKKLKWKPKTNIKNLIREMIAHEEK